MAKISIQDMAKAIAGKHGLAQRDAEAFVSALFDVINDGLHTEKAVKVKGLGTFKVIDVRERESVNVNTGERVVIESHGKITFTPDPVMRDLVNKPFAQFETVVLNDGVDLEEMGRIQEKEDDDMPSQDDGVSIGCVLDDDEKEPAAGGEPSATTAVEDDADAGADDFDAQAVDGGYGEDLQDETSTANAGGSVETGREDALSIEKPESGCVGEEASEVCLHDENNSQSQESVAADCCSLINETAHEPATASDGYDGDSFLSRHMVACFIFTAILVGVAAFVGGYYCGRSSVKPVVRTRTVYINPKPVTTTEKADATHAKDTVKAAKTATQNADTLKTAEPKQQTANEKVQPSADVKNSTEYQNAMAIMKTGAYRIVGTAQTVTVKKGETLKGISKFYLGDGMECYIQVHNGVLDVKEGMKLKIPKLENKLKRKSR